MLGKIAPVYQYNTGDIIKMHAGGVGMIVGKTSASDYLSFEQHVKDTIAKAYSNIPIYKVLLYGRITFVNESNIECTVQCGNQKNNM